MAKKIANKSVSFNVLDPDQAELLAHAEKRPNFSGYVKRLIQRDLEGGGRAKAHGDNQQKEESPGHEDRGWMKGLI